MKESFTTAEKEHLRQSFSHQRISSCVLDESGFLISHANWHGPCFPPRLPEPSGGWRRAIWCQTKQVAFNHLFHHPPHHPHNMGIKTTVQPGAKTVESSSIKQNCQMRTMQITGKAKLHFWYFEFQKLDRNYHIKCQNTVCAFKGTRKSPAEKSESLEPGCRDLTLDPHCRRDGRSEVTLPKLRTGTTSKSIAFKM